jgi:hypothetical protein
VHWWGCESITTLTVTGARGGGGGLDDFASNYMRRDRVLRVRCTVFGEYLAGSAVGTQRITPHKLDGVGRRMGGVGSGMP